MSLDSVLKEVYGRWFGVKPSGPDLGKVVAVSKAQLGKPYKFGAKWDLKDPEPKGPIDCSGFIRWTWAQVGIAVPDGSQFQYDASCPIVQPRPTDLGFFKALGKDCHHVGMILDDVNVIEARGLQKDAAGNMVYNAVILRPRVKWEAWREFTGWRRLSILGK